MQRSDHPCDVSPFCGSVADLLGAPRLPTDLAWNWAHLGPIAVDGVGLVEHHDGSPWTKTQVLGTGPVLARFGGYHLDVLGVDVLGTAARPPAFPASYHPLLRRWYVYAVAWRDPDGPSVAWRVQRFGVGDLLIRQPGDWPDADAIVGRCKDLLAGRFVRRGRPPKSETASNEDGLQVVLQVEQIKLQPRERRTRDEIAADLGFDPRTVRRYRAEARRLGQLADDAIRRLA